MSRERFTEDAHGMSDRPPRSTRAWLIVPVGAAAAMLVLALTLDAETLARWFQHPARPAGASLAGARLLRIMLVACAALLAVSAIGMTRFGRPALRPAREPVSSRSLWVLVGLVILGLLLRAMRLNESLWYDEVAAWREYAAHGPGAIIGNYFDPSNHVLHTLLTWVSVTATTGPLTVESAFRLPALLFSLGSIAAVYALARRPLGDRVALVAAAVMAAAPASVLEGVEARGYSMMMCLAALATWSWPGLDDHPQRPWRPLVYAALAAAGVWSHLTTVFVPVGHAAARAIGAFTRRAGAAPGSGRGSLVPAMVGLLLAAGMTATLLAPLLPDAVRSAAMFRSAGGGEPKVLGLEGWHVLLQLGGSWSWWAAAPGLALGAIGFAAARRDSRAWPVLAASMLGLAIMMIALLAAGSWMYARFALFAMPGAAVLMAIGFDRLWRWRRGAAALAAAVVVGGWMIDLAMRPPKQPLREAADFARATFGESAPGLVIELRHQALDPYLSGMTIAYSLHHGADVEHQLAARPPAWIIIVYPRSVAADRFDRIEREFDLLRRFRGWVDWDNGDVLVFGRKPIARSPGADAGWGVLE